MTSSPYMASNWAYSDFRLGACNNSQGLDDRHEEPGHPNGKVDPCRVPSGSMLGLTARPWCRRRDVGPKLDQHPSCTELRF